MLQAPMGWQSISSGGCGYVLALSLTDIDGSNQPSRFRIQKGTCTFPEVPITEEFQIKSFVIGVVGNVQLPRRYPLISPIHLSTRALNLNS